MKVYPPRDIRPFVMYCVNGKPRSSLLIESTDSMIQLRANTTTSANRPTCSSNLLDEQLVYKSTTAQGTTLSLSPSLWRIWLIPTYRVYLLYDTDSMIVSNEMSKDSHKHIPKTYLILIQFKTPGMDREAICLYKFLDTMLAQM